MKIDDQRQVTVSRMRRREPMPERMKSILLSRTGLPPLKFTGRLVADESEPLPPFKKATQDYRRWHELRLFESRTTEEQARYVLSIGFRTGLETENDCDTVLICDSLDDVMDVLTEATDVDIEDPDYDPLERIEGFPDQPQYAKRQADLERRILEDFAVRASRILEKVGAAETI